MKTPDIRDMTKADIEVKMVELKKDLLEAQKSLAANELPNPNAIKKLRRDIARLHTIRTEKAGESEVEAADKPKKATKKHNDKEDK